jgi:hypothetical protein
MLKVRKAVLGVVAVAAAFGLSVVGTNAAIAAPESATSRAVVAAPTSGAVSVINRIACAGRTDFLWIFSDNTTCWANPGSTSVALYNVNGVRGGANSGYIYQSASATYNFFFANQTIFGVNPAYTVTNVTIY